MALEMQEVIEYLKEVKTLCEQADSLSRSDMKDHFETIRGGAIRLMREAGVPEDKMNAEYME